MLEGRIIKSLSGFYTVKAAEGNFTCKGRGVFRNRNITPCVGDDVLFEKLDDKTGYIKEVKPRDNEFIRPQIANMTQALVVHSAVQPAFNPLLLDRFLVKVESKRIKPMILISKKDLATDEEREKVTSFKSDYEQVGYDVVIVALEVEEE